MIYEMVYSYLWKYFGRICNICNCRYKYVYVILFNVITVSNWVSLEFYVIHLLNSCLMLRFIDFRFDNYSLDLCDLVRLNALFTYNALSCLVDVFVIALNIPQLAFVTVAKVTEFFRVRRNKCVEVI